MTNLCNNSCTVIFESNQPGYQNQFVANVYLPEVASQDSNFDITFSADYDGNTIYVSISVYIATGDSYGSNTTNYGLYQTLSENWTVYNEVIVGLNPTNQFNLIDCISSTTTTTTTFIPSSDYASWGVAQESFVGVICNSYSSYTLYTSTGYTLAPLTIPCFYTNTGLTVKFNPGYNDVLGYVELPGTNSLYHADINSSGDLSGQTACPNYYQYLITQVGQTGEITACAYIRDVYVYANTNIISDVTKFYTDTSLTTLFLPDTYGYVSYVLVSYMPLVVTGTILNSGGTVTYIGSCAYYPTTTTTTTAAATSYKKKYWLQFTGEDQVRNIVDIYQNTSNTITLEEVKGMESPFIVEMPSVSKFNPTRGTGCEINLLSVTDRQYFNELYSVDPKSILVKHYRTEPMYLDPSFVLPEYVPTTTTTTLAPTTTTTLVPTTTTTLSPTTTTTTSCSGIFYTGQTAQGGIVFYVWSGGTNGYIASLTDAGTQGWGCYGSLLDATGSTIGSGKQNTQQISSLCSTSAAALCTGSTILGYNDWFLPSKDEFTEMNKLSTELGLSGGYWESTEATAQQAYVGGATQSKFNNNKVRPIREFSNPCLTTTTTTGDPTTTTTGAPTTTTTSTGAPTTTTTSTAAPTTTTTTTISGATDYDGNVYTEIVIGSQTWLKQPLRATHTIGGTAITTYNPNNDINNVGGFGKLYNWYQLTGTSTESLAPTGYHVATLNDWRTLLSGYSYTYSSGKHYTLAGDDLKATGSTTFWNVGNNGTDDFGFTMGGAGYYDGVSYVNFKNYNWTWTTTSINSNDAYIEQFTYNNSEIYEPDNGLTKTYYFGNVRMVKDTPIPITTTTTTIPCYHFIAYNNSPDDWYYVKVVTCAQGNTLIIGMEPGRTQDGCYRSMVYESGTGTIINYGRC